MSNRLTNVLLLALLVLLVFGIAVNQHEQRRLNDSLRDVVDRLDELALAPDPRPDPPGVVNPTDTAQGAEPPADSPPLLRADPPPTPAVAVADPPIDLSPLDDAGESTVAPVAVEVPAEAPPPSDGADGADGPEDAAGAEDVAAPPAVDPADRPHPEWPRYESLVTSIIEDLLAGRYQPVLDRRNADMAFGLTRQVLARTMDRLRARHGRFDKVIKQRRSPKGDTAGMHQFIVTVATTDGGPLVFSITLDDADQLAGLYVRE